MAKKVKFPLEMKDGVKVRTIEELRQFFDAEKVLTYFLNGKLASWLLERHYDEYYAQLQKLDNTDANCLQEICRILEIENIGYDDNVDIEEIENKNKKIMQIMQYTDDKAILKNIELVAMNQSEFAALLNSSSDLIYLCGDKFNCPSDLSNITIVGVNNPEVHINATSVIDFEADNVTFRNIRFDEEYQKLVEQLKYEEEHKNDKKNIPYKASSLFDIRLSDEDRRHSEKLYKLMQQGLGDIEFDVDVYTRKLHKQLLDANLYDGLDIDVIGQKQRECLQNAHLDVAFDEFCSRNDI